MAGMKVHDADILVPNFKTGVTGVTATIVQLTRIHQETARVAIVGCCPAPDLPVLSLPGLVGSWRRPRVWHARRNGDLLMGLVLKHLLGLKIVIVFTCSNPRPRTWLTRTMLQRVDAIVGTSASMQKCMPQPLVAIIPHGINRAVFRPADTKQGIRRQLGLPEGFLVGAFGRLRPEKGTDILVEAGLSLLQDYPETRFLILGKTGRDHHAYVRKMQQTIAAAGAKDRFLFRAEVPYGEIPFWYQALDLFVAVPRWEGFGLTVLEAMASGVPVVASRQGIFASVVTPGKTGRLVACDHPQEVCGAMAAMMDDLTGPAGAYRAVADHIPEVTLIETEARSLLDQYRRLLGTLRPTAEGEDPGTARQGDRHDAAGGKTR